MKYLTMFLVLAVVLCSCATTPEIDQPLPDLTFEKEEIYVLDLSELQLPEPPNFIFLINDNGTLREATDYEQPTHVAMLQDDLNKIDAMLTIKRALEDVAKEQATLINIEREKVNALKELLALERSSRQLERTLRLEVEKTLHRERRDHRIDNIVSRATLVLTVIGGVAIAAL